jgi:phytoene/squalene synthetase
MPDRDTVHRDSADRDLADCRRLLANGSRTFMAASWLLPRAVREPACALYAYCRQADDEVDGVADPASAVAGLRLRLAALYAGRPAERLADRALAAVAQRHGIPPALPEALIEGFAWDAEGRRYETLDDVQAYAARVAGTVGAMMALLMGTRDPAALARACDLGVAMQLSNIARDVGEDAAMGRLYLPRSWLREAGIDPDEWLAARCTARRWPAWCAACWTLPTSSMPVSVPAWPSCRWPAGPASMRRASCTPRSATRWRAAGSTRWPAAPWCRAGASWSAWRVPCWRCGRARTGCRRHRCRPMPSWCTPCRPGRPGASRCPGGA